MLTNVVVEESGSYHCLIFNESEQIKYFITDDIRKVEDFDRVISYKPIVCLSASYSIKETFRDKLNCSDINKFLESIYRIKVPKSDYKTKCVMLWHIIRRLENMGQFIYRVSGPKQMTLGPMFRGRANA